MFGEQQYSSYTVEKMMVGVSGVFNDMQARPFFMHTPESSLDEFMMKTSNGLNINQNSVQLENQSLIQVSAQSEGTIEIDGGWNTNRNVFVMIIRNIHDGSKFILSGFTSPDFMAGHNYNEYAILTFNSVIELQAITEYNGQVRYELYNADNILSMSHLNGGVNGQSITSPQRPTDVLDNALLRAETISNSSSEISSDTPIIHVGMADAMGTGSRTPSLSRATNGAANDYLYRTARAFSDSCLTGSDQDDLTHQLQGAVDNSIIREGSYDEMPLINTILNNAGNRRNANCSMADLVNTMPNLPSVLEIVQGDSGVSMEGTTHWQGRGDVSVVAELGAAIPAIMLKFAIQAIGFQMTSVDAYSSMDGYTNTFNIKENPQTGGAMISFIAPDIPQEAMVAKFTAYMRNVVFPTACKGRNVSIDVECTTTKSMTIAVSIDGSHPVTRTAPTFDTSAWNPASSTTVRSNTSMSDGMLNLTSYMVSSQEGNQSPVMIAPNNNTSPISDDGLF